MGKLTSPLLVFSISITLSANYRYSGGCRDGGIGILRRSRLHILPRITTHAHSRRRAPPSISHPLVLKKERQRLPLFIAPRNPTPSLFLPALSLSFYFSSAFLHADASSAFPNYLYAKSNRRKNVPSTIS